MTSNVTAGDCMVNLHGRGLVVRVKVECLYHLGLEADACGGRAVGAHSCTCGFYFVSLPCCLVFILTVLLFSL